MIDRAAVFKFEFSLFLYTDSDISFEESSMISSLTGNIKYPLLWIFNSLLIAIGVLWLVADAFRNLVKKVLSTMNNRTEVDVTQVKVPSRPLLVITSAICVFVIFSMSSAIAEEDHIVARKLQESGQILSFEKIADYARAAKAGELLETELELKKGNYIYEVEILDTAGKVWELKLNAKTGELLQIEVDD